jgi:hypothetical protein
LFNVIPENTRPNELLLCVIDVWEIKKKEQYIIYIHIYMDRPFLTPLGLLFLVCTSNQQKMEPSNEHSYQVWFQLPSIGPVVLEMKMN